MREFAEGSDKNAATVLDANSRTLKVCELVSNLIQICSLLKYKILKAQTDWQLKNNAPQKCINLYNIICIYLQSA